MQTFSTQLMGHVPDESERFGYIGSVVHGSTSGITPIVTLFSSLEHSKSANNRLAMHPNRLLQAIQNHTLLLFRGAKVFLQDILNYFMFCCHSHDLTTVTHLLSNRGALGNSFN